MQIKEIICLTCAKLVFPVCPQCGGAIEREYIEYCLSCDQKLSWKGFEFIEMTCK